MRAQTNRDPTADDNVRQDPAFEEAVRKKIANKTKPPGSLGKIEALALQLALIQETLNPRAESCQLLLFAADHGIAESGVSAFPQSVTRQMVENFLDGGAAACVFARTVGVQIQVVDAGVLGPPIEHTALHGCRLGNGTANALTQAAMTREQLDRGLVAGRQLGREAGGEALCLGEMGIGNTSAASLMLAKLMGSGVAPLAGRGTGLDDASFEQKLGLLRQAAERTAPQLPAEETLLQYGGFEIVMMAGAMIGAASAGKAVLVDGFIATAAAAAACQLEPAVRPNLIFAHRSAEAGHRLALEFLGAQPLLDLEMRLGEGTGALLAWPLVRAAAAMLSDMASFDSAGVSQS
ncbi:MAG: nicotinate-nucleotide--dimethylbenzimidazole phosphoribosyltransferase [Pseudomonadota bacterium]